MGIYWGNINKIYKENKDIFIVWNRSIDNDI